MKIRWTRHSVRFRITPEELADLLEGREVREALELPSGKLSAEIRTGTTTGLGLVGGDLAITLSAEDIARLGEPEREGVYFEADTGGVRYYVEKDFPCVHPRASTAGEPASGTFPAPAGFEERKTD